MHVKMTRIESTRRVTVPKGLFTLQECQDSDGRHSIKFQIIRHHHVNVPQLNNYN
jgi:hypothetical protein